MPDDQDDEQDDEQDDSPDEPVAEAPAPLPRAKRATVAHPAALQPFGTIPGRATTWGMDRRTELGAWEKLFYQDETGRLRVSEWLPAELSLAEVESRWGPGHYRASWFGPGSKGGRQRVGGGREFTILPRPESATPAIPVSDDPVMAGLERAFRLQAILDGRASQQLATQAQMMQMMMGVGGGASPEIERLRAENSRLVQVAADQRYDRLAAEFAQLRSELVDDTPLEPGVVAQAAGAVARAGARRVFSKRPIGESLQGAFSTWIAEDPIGAGGQILEALKTIPKALEALSKFLPGNQPQPHPQLAPAAPMPPERAPSPPPPPSPGAFAKADPKPRAVRIVPPSPNGAPPAPSPPAVAPTEPPPVEP